MATMRQASVLLLALAVTVLLAQRWRTASAPARRVLAPVVWASIGTAALFVMTNFGVVKRLHPDLTDPVEGLALALFPFAFVVGLLRTRVTRSTLGELVAALGAMPQSGGLEGHLGRALGDPSVRVGYWVDEAGGYVDGGGQRLEVTDGRGATEVRSGGGPLAVLVHDPALHDDEGLVDAVAAAARLALERERLQAQVRAQLGHLRDSRSRLVSAEDRERRRIERELHGGAQQHLVALGMRLRLMAAQAQREGDTQRAGQIEAVLAEVQAAGGELRDLAQGLHPTVLTEQGLAAAIRSLAERSPVPVEVAEVCEERFAEAVEIAAYYTVAEALANVAKYAQASRATVTAARRNGHLAIHVSDDGVGGATLTSGTGLRGLHDRIDAAGGTLTLHSPTGNGTTLTAQLPATEGATAGVG